MVIYLDNNATTRCEPAVIDAMNEMLTESWGNPSSSHRMGQAARNGIELARQALAALIGGLPAEVIFTSGSTESINLAIRGRLGALWKENPDKRTLITTAIEHEAVRDLGASLADEAGVEIRTLPLAPGGVVDTDALESIIDDRTAIVSVQWANNETGVIQPMQRIGDICRERGVTFHTDATQLIGKLPIDLKALPIDLLSLSAHKFHGPKGVGALWVRRGVRVRPIARGSQERERRGGTENTAGIVGMGIAANAAKNWLAIPSERERLAAMRDRFEQAVLRAVPEARVNGVEPGTERLWNTTNIAFPRLEAEAMLLLLSERGVCASAGAACSSGSLDPSPILLAMGVPPEFAHGSIRFSLSRHTTEQELNDAAGIIVACVERLRTSGIAAGRAR